MNRAGSPSNNSSPRPAPQKSSDERPPLFPEAVGDAWLGGLSAGLFALVLAVSIAACSNRPPRDTDSIWDSKWLDSRVSETPRQRTLRQCQQECERFRVECTTCHTTGKEAEIGAKDLKLTPLGARARVMRNSATFGLHTHCSVCHLTKFGLTGYAQKMFGPEGEKHRAIEAELNQTTIK